MNFGVLLFIVVCLGLLYWRHRYTQEMASAIEKAGYHAVATVRSYRKE